MQRSMSDWGGNIAAFIVVIAINALANGLPIGGQTTGQVSAKYPSLFTPEGFSFSIWGLIYLGLAGFVIWQALPAQRNNQVIASIGALFVANCLTNAAWILVWHYELLWLSALLMIAILFTLVRIYQALENSVAAASPAEQTFLHLPFSVYTGWITVATIANLSALQTGMGWDNSWLGIIDWTLLKLAVAGAIGATVILRKGDIAFVLVIAWAAFGIAIKQVATPEVAGAATTLYGVALLLAGAETVRKMLAA